MKMKFNIAIEDTLPKQTMLFEGTFWFMCLIYINSGENTDTIAVI